MTGKGGKIKCLMSVSDLRYISRSGCNRFCNKGLDFYTDLDRNRLTLDTLHQYIRVKPWKNQSLKNMNACGGIGCNSDGSARITHNRES